MPHTLRSIALGDEQAAELSMLCGFDDDLTQQATATSNRIRGLLTQIHPALERVIGPHLDHPAMAELLVKHPTPDEQAAELSMLCGFDDDLTQQATATSNRIRGLLIQIHPALERVIGPHLDHPAMAELLVKYPTPDALHKAGQTRVGEHLRRWAPRAGKGWAAEIFTALSEQTVVVAGTGAAGIVLPRLGAQLAQLRAARADVLTRVEAIVEAHPLHTVLTSMPAVGARTEARIITARSSARTSTPPGAWPPTPD